DERPGREVVRLRQESAADERIPLLLVTHDNRILDVADRIVNMVDGRIKSDVVVREADLIVEFIHNMAPFRGLTLSTLASIADKMWAEQHEAGEVVVRQGDPGKNFYVIRQ